MITEASAVTTLSVSIVVHESTLEHLDATLRSLDVAVQLAQDRGSLGRATITVLDNGSTADYRARLRRQVVALNARLSATDSATGSATDSTKGGTRGSTKPGNSTVAVADPVKLVMEADNAGYGAGHNAAQRDTASDLVLVLNPDTELSPEALDEALAFLASREDVVALNPRCVGSDGDAQYLCKRYPSLLVLALRALPFAVLRALFAQRLAHYEYRDLDPGLPAPVRLLSGACLLCRRSAFVTTGGFDERFFMYFEDFDLSLRLAEHGKVFYLPGMRIVHHGGHAARKGLRHSVWFLRSALRFFHRHGWRLR
jgi:GT2 family glycosyltransferase